MIEANEKDVVIGEWLAVKEARDKLLEAIQAFEQADGKRVISSLFLERVERMAGPSLAANIEIHMEMQYRTGADGYLYL